MVATHDQTPASKVYLVTGANVGLGLEAVRQLALQTNTKKVYLACRSQEKAENAIELLVSENHELQRDRLAFVPFNGSADKNTVCRSILNALPEDEKIDGLIFNAGGVGGDSTGRRGGPNNILDMAQINIIGHVHLLETLRTNDHLKEKGTTIVYSGSEAARGIPIRGLRAPNLPDTVEGYREILTGASFQTFDTMTVYAATKATAALYWAAWARKNPQYYVLTVSPGGTAGTSIASQGGFNRMSQLTTPMLMAASSVLGIAHGVEVGAKRYVDAVDRSGAFAEMESGAFVASVRGVSGPVGDQREHRNGQPFGDYSMQDAAFNAIQTYV